MRRVFRRLIRRVNTSEWTVSWFEVPPGEQPDASQARLGAPAASQPAPGPGNAADDGAGNALDHDPDSGGNRER